jgi:hypothetical protein
MLAWCHFFGSLRLLVGLVGLIQHHEEALSVIYGAALLLAYCSMLAPFLKRFGCDHVVFIKELEEIHNFV